MKLEELRRTDTWRESAAEFIATLLFVFLGAGTVVVTGLLTGGELTTVRLVTIAFAHGLAIILLVAATANISGGHINPAVTVAAILTRNMGISKGTVYIVAQLSGAILGALLIAAVVPGAINGPLGSHALGSNVSVGAGLLAETILTFVLVFVVIATAMDSKGLKNMAPVAIGLAVLVDHLIGIPLTGASMNPARSFGPALVSGTWDAHWIFWAGPVLGGTLAALVYKMVFMKPATVEPEIKIELPFEGEYRSAKEERELVSTRW